MGGREQRGFHLLARELLGEDLGAARLASAWHSLAVEATPGSRVTATKRRHSGCGDGRGWQKPGRVKRSRL